MFIQGRKGKFLIWFILILMLIASSSPNMTFNLRKIKALGIRLDHISHFSAYFFIGLLWFLVYGLSLKSVSLILLFMLIEEGHQWFIPNRSTNFSDLTYDLLGLSFSLIILTCVNFINKRITKRDIIKL